MEGRGTPAQDGETQTMPKQAAARSQKKGAPHTMQGASCMCRLLAAR